MNKTLKIVLSIFSILVSSAFVIFGASIYFEVNPPIWLKAIGIITIIYGILNIALLINAWKSKAKLNHKLSMWLSIALFSATLIGSFDVGMISGLEFFSLLIIAGMLAVNWFAVKIVASNQ